MNITSVFSRKSKIQLLFEKILEYCKNEILKDRIINIPNLITNNKKFPLYGLHSTTYSVLQNIYKNGFAANSGIRIGLTQDNPIIALFTIPFSINYEELIPNVGTNPGITITISNGINRSILYPNDNHNDDDDDDDDANFLTFPIILACFTDSDKVEISNNWITCYDKNDIHIVGHFDIKINKDKNYEKYIEYKKKSDQEKFQIKAYAKMLELQYIVNFTRNEEFEEKNTIPVSIKNPILIKDSKLGGKSNKIKHQLRINKSHITRKNKKNYL
jgi:hypothetical protein